MVIILWYGNDIRGRIDATIMKLNKEAMESVGNNKDERLPSYAVNRDLFSDGLRSEDDVVKVGLDKCLFADFDAQSVNYW